jgi:general secretion pathway protein M
MKQSFAQSLAKLQQWLDSLESRERLLVSVGALVVGITLLYLLIWEPVAKAHHNREAELVISQQLANRIELLAGQTRINPTAGASRGLSLLSAVDQASKSGTLNKPLSRIQPEGDTEVKIWIEAVSFDALLRWIAQLQSSDGVVVRSAQIEKDAGPGLVSAQLSLVRP